MLLGIPVLAWSIGNILRKRRPDVVINPYSHLSEPTEMQRMVPPMWGWTEAMGWHPGEEGLADLGELAESRYRLNVELGTAGMIE